LLFSLFHTNFCLIRILGRVQHADAAANGYTWPLLPLVSGRAPPAADPRHRRSGALPYRHQYSFRATCYVVQFICTEVLHVNCSDTRHISPGWLLVNQL